MTRPKDNCRTTGSRTPSTPTTSCSSREDYADTIIAYKNGNPVRLSDVATVIEGPENAYQAAWMNTTPAVILNIQRQPGANIIKVVDSIKLRLKQLQANLPASVKVEVLTDRTNTIRASVKDVQFELMLTVVLVVMVIFLFLRTLSATIIPSIAVPLSLVGTFGVMYLLDYSLDNLSLMALTISTGFVVDDAIVMIENISRYIEEGLHAARGGAARLGTDRIHHRFADGVADRGADPAAVHGRHRGTAVPRVRRDAERDHSAVGGDFADADADDVRAAAAAARRGAPRPVLRGVGKCLQQDHRVLRAHSAVRVAAPDGRRCWSPSARWSRPSGCT